jgi:large subunit ribosomal protein L7/L12
LSYPSTSPSSSFHSTSNLNDNYAQSPKVDQVFDKILQLDLVEVHLLTELVNEKLGIKPMTAAQRAAMAGGGGGGGSAAGAAPAEEPEEKTAFDLKLTGFDAKSKIKVIKVVRAITGLGLKEAKEMVEGAPKTIKKEIKMEECEEIKAQLEAVGGTVEIS